MIRCSTSLVGVMEAYFFYMEMAVVRFYYEVQKLGCFSHWCDKRSVKSFCKKVWFDSTVSHEVERYGFESHTVLETGRLV